MASKKTTKKTSKKSANGMTVKAYRGDAKTLLAFNLPKAQTKNLAGFTIFVEPKGQEPFYLQNQLRFEDPTKHAQNLKLPPNSKQALHPIRSAGSIDWCGGRLCCLSAWESC